MEIDDDSRYHVFYPEKMTNYVSDQSFEEKRFKNNKQDGDDYSVNPNEMIDNQNKHNNVIDLTDFIRNIGGSEAELVFENIRCHQESWPVVDACFTTQES